MWIFISEFGTVLLYAVMYFQLRRQIAASEYNAGWIAGCCVHAACGEW
jgi:hypothetical protein